MSKAMVRVSGEMSRESQLASSMVKVRLRGVINGRARVRAAAFTALSFCAAVWAERGAEMESARARVGASRRERVMDRAPGARKGRPQWAAGCGMAPKVRMARGGRQHA